MCRRDPKRGPFLFKRINPSRNTTVMQIQTRRGQILQRLVHYHRALFACLSITYSINYAINYLSSLYCLFHRIKTNGIPTINATTKATAAPLRNAIRKNGSK